MEAHDKNHEEDIDNIRLGEEGKMTSLENK